jgi:AAA15 family ATPase/GTPase
MVIVGSPIIEQQPGMAAPTVVRISFAHLGDDQEFVNLDFAEESAGTQLLFRTAGAWLNVFEKGEVLLFDEIDTSLHPNLIAFLIKRFHSQKTNPNNAQLVFSTHNTSMLDQDIFRRDQIWFVDKGNDKASRLI